MLREPLMGTRFVELHDSDLLAVRAEDFRVVLTMVVILHHDDGPGHHTVWQQDADLVIDEARVEERPDSTPLWILEGSVSSDEGRFSNVLPLPFEARKAVRVEFLGAEGTCTVTGTRARLELRGETRFLETYLGA
jgi:hypothetical protein